jgi:hypothetical protein
LLALGLGEKLRIKKQKKNNSQIKNILRSEVNSTLKLKKIFSSLSLSEIRIATRELYSIADFNQFISLNRNENLSNIYNYAIPDTTIDKSVYWSIGVLINNIDKLKYFIVQEKKITNLLLLNEFDKSLAVLDDIDAKCGISVWSLSLRSSILEDSGNLNKIKELADNTQSGLSSFNMFNVISKHVIYKDISNDSVQENRTRLDRQLRSAFISDSEDLYYFIKYKVISFIPTDEYNFEHIFNFEKNSTLIDLYVCCCDFATYGVLHKKYSSLTKEIIEVIGKRLVDSVFYKLLDLFEHKNNWLVNDLDVNLLDAYSKGDYEYCYRQIKSAEDNLDFSHIEIAAKSACRVKVLLDENNKDKLIVLLKDFLLKKDNYHDSKNEIFRMQNKYRNLSFYKKIILFIEMSEVRTDTNITDALKKTLYLLSDINSPFKSEFINDNLKNRFMTSMGQSGYCETDLIWKVYEGEIDFKDSRLDSVCYVRKLSYYCKYLMKIGSTSKGLEILSSLVLQNDKLISYEASNNLLLYYNMIGDDKSAVDLYNKLVLGNRNAIHILDNDKALISAEKLIKLNLSLPAIITFSLYSRYVDSSLSSKLRAVFNSLMRINDCVDPLRINDNKIFDYEEYIYFLRYICTPKIMKFFKHFRNPTDIDKCRINICNYLMTVDRNKDLIGNELKDITKKLVLRDATLQVAQSKVDADISSLKSGENEAHISLYHKYMNLVRENYADFEKVMSLYEVIEILKNNSLDLAYVKRNTSQDEIGQIFIKLVKTVLEEFSFGEKGLNANISTRIRHGHLPNTVRRSLLDENLITSVSEPSRSVKTNDFWLEKVSDKNNGDSINRVFNNFTLLINDLIYTINEEVLQVSTLDESLAKLSKQENPLFLYTPTDMKIILLQKKINFSTTYNEFINIIEAWLWDVTQDNLHNIREYILTHLSDQIISDFTSDISKLIIDKEKLYDFTNAANRAKASFRKDINTIVSWFKKKEFNASSSFDFEIAVQIASQALLLDIKLTDGSHLKMKGDKLSCFVDILYILYENSISKSGLPKSELEISHSIELKDNILKVLYRNKCGEIESIASKSNIQQFIDSYGDESKMMQRLHSEGGTGFAKIWKVITKDLGCEHKINFGITDDCYFEVEIIINIKGYIINESPIG